MAKNDDIIVFVGTLCGACELVKEALKDQPGIRILDINDPEADAYFGPDEEVVVPVARFPDGQWCQIEGDREKMEAVCGPERRRLK